MQFKLRRSSIGCFCALSVCVVAVLAMTGVSPRVSAAVTAPATLGACGPLVHSRSVIEPQAVDMWQAPVDASGEHELILAAHTDDGGNRFCYVYRWRGVVHYVAPAIHMRGGETFA
ncbi:MAG: hypothetical protein ACRETQ_02980, partial [Gammaproteobacteria bacterium]